MRKIRISAIQLVCLVALVILHWNNNIFAGEERYLLIVQEQAEQIKQLERRVNELENLIDAINTKIFDAKIEKELYRSLSILSSENSLSVQKNDDLRDSLHIQSEDAQSNYDLALSYLKDEKFDEAEQEFANFVQVYKGHKLREKAMFWYGESFYRRGEFNKAALNYLKSYKEYPKGTKAASSLLKLSLSLGALNKYNEACSILVKLDEEFQNNTDNILKRSGEAKRQFKCNEMKDN